LLTGPRFGVDLEQKNFGANELKYLESMTCSSANPSKELENPYGRRLKLREQVPDTSSDTGKRGSDLKGRGFQPRRQDDPSITTDLKVP